MAKQLPVEASMSVPPKRGQSPSGKLLELAATGLAAVVEVRALVVLVGLPLAVLRVLNFSFG